VPKLIAIWSKPDDVDGFEADYTSTHAPMVESIPGVRFEAGKVVDGDAYRVAILSFDSAESMQEGMGSDAAGATMQDAGRLQEQYGASLQAIVIE
jgi:uncharacterized protein (TIGR02118 family)